MDKRCGTCEMWGAPTSDHDYDQRYRPCLATVPQWARGATTVHAGYGGDCPCWTPKEADREGV